MRGSRGLAAALVLAAVLAPAATASADTPAPAVEEIAPDAGIHGHPLWDPWFDPAAFGYETHEFLVSGTATATGSDATADYTTRIVVTRPSDPDDFAGSVLLDWVNVTAQFENPVNTLTSIEFLLREGWAFVHVSAQAAGICCTPLTPAVFDPVRYAALDHPGDEYANDMFRQVAHAVRGPADVAPLGPLDVEVVIAAGQSQGGSRLSDYLVTTATADGPVDAVLQQAGGSKTYEQAPPIPVIHLLGDREGTPEPPTPWPTYRLWEVAASAHQDMWVGRQQTEGQAVRLATGAPLSREQAESLWASAGSYGEQVDPRSGVCIVNGAQFPTRYVANAALAHLDRWVRDGVAAPTADRYQFDGDALAADDLGNTLGGIRLPPVDVPVARYEADLCNLGGITIPLTDAELLERYGDHATYHAQMVAATERSLSEGFLLPADATDLLDRSCAARPRFGEPATGECAGAPTPTTSPPAPTPDTDEDTAPSPTPPRAAADPAPLPATGGGAAGAGLLVLLAGLSHRRSR